MVIAIPEYRDYILETRYMNLFKKKIGVLKSVKVLVSNKPIYDPFQCRISQVIRKKLVIFDFILKMRTSEWQNFMKFCLALGTYLADQQKSRVSSF